MGSCQALPVSAPSLTSPSFFLYGLDHINLAFDYCSRCKGGLNDLSELLGFEGVGCEEGGVVLLGPSHIRPALHVIDPCTFLEISAPVPEDQDLSLTALKKLSCQSTRTTLLKPA